MKKILFIMFLVLLSLGVNAFAAGDLTVKGNATVNGTLNVGAGGVKFPDGSTQTTAISPTTQNNVTASRALGTVYRNTTGKPMWVRVIQTNNGGIIVGYSDNNSTPTTLVDETHSHTTAAYTSSVGFWVLPNNYYKVTAGGLRGWIEYY